MSEAEGRTPDPSAQIATGRPLWNKAPTRLLRRPALFASFAAAALLLSVTAAAYPLFLSSARSQMLASTIADPSFTPFGVGVAYRATAVPFAATTGSGVPLAAARRRAFVRLAADEPLLGPVFASMAAPPVQIVGPARTALGAPLAGRLFTGDDALRHVRIVSGHEGNGVWLPDSIAKGLGAQPGDRVQLNDGGDVVTVRVDGIYRALNEGPDDGYWQPWSQDIYAALGISCPDLAACPLPPQFLIVSDAARFRRLQEALRDARADQVLAAPVRSAPPITFDQARGLAAFAGRMAHELHGPGPLAGLFRCCGESVVASATSTITFQSAASGVVSTVQERIAGLQGPVLVLLFAGLAISFAVMAVAGVFSFASRPAETGMLQVRGWSPPRVGAKSAVESAIPIIGGAIAGLALALLVVRWLGPSAPWDHGALRTATVSTAIAAVASIVGVGVVVAVSFSAAGHARRQRLTRALVWVPWELLALAAVVWLRGRLHAAGDLVPQAGTSSRPAGIILLFPLAVGLAAGILAARLISGLFLIRSRSRGGISVSARWLAVRRLATSLRVVVVFLVATTLAVSVFVGAQAVVASLRTTVDAKARLYVGSDVELQGAIGVVHPAHFPLPITLVQRALSAGWFGNNQQRPFDLVVIDPATFAGAAYWNPRLSDMPLTDLVDAIARPAAGGATPIVVANDPSEVPTTITIDRSQIPVTVVGRAESFPGAASTNPIVVMTRASVERALHEDPGSIRSTLSTTELWIRGPVDTALAAMGPAGIQTERIVTADQVKDVPLLVSAVNTFIVMDVLGAVALLLVLVLSVVYLQVRQRSRGVASALSDRMGSSGVTSWLALTFELGAPMLVALVVGAAVGVLVVPPILSALDPLPSIPPPPLLVTPWAAVLAAAAVLTVATLAGAWLAHRATRRISLAEVMRVGG